MISSLLVRLLHVLYLLIHMEISTEECRRWFILCSNHCLIHFASTATNLLLRIECACCVVQANKRIIGKLWRWRRCHNFHIGGNCFMVFMKRFDHIKCEWNWRAPGATTFSLRSIWRTTVAYNIVNNHVRMNSRCRKKMILLVNMPNLVDSFLNLFGRIRSARQHARMFYLESRTTEWQKRKKL